VWDAFVADPQVILADVHQDARTFWYSRGDEPEPAPIRGPRCRCLALRPGAGDDGFLRDAWTELLPWLDAHAPRFIVLNAGADGLAGDRLAGLLYSPATHARVTRDLVTLADRHADGRLLALGGGGYHPENRDAAWLAVLAALLAPPTLAPASSPCNPAS
jgi:acetoin utilization protein AcuC